MCDYVLIFSHIDFFMQRTDDSSFTGQLRDSTVAFSEGDQAKSMDDFVMSVEMTPVKVKRAAVSSDQDQSITEH